MPTSSDPTPRDPRADLQAWYLASLQPKLRRAASTGMVRTAAVNALDRQLRELLDLPVDARQQAA
jgi:hypothetical protein